MACLLESILAAWNGFGFHFGGLGDILGMAWLLSWPGDLRMGWTATKPGRVHCVTEARDPCTGQSWG